MLASTNGPAVEETWSTDTSVVWIGESYSRRRWLGGRIGPQAMRGEWFATHPAWPGMWGTGATREAAIDELIAAARGCYALFPEWPECDPRYSDWLATLAARAAAPAFGRDE